MRYCVSLSVCHCVREHQAKRGSGGLTQFVCGAGNFLSSVTVGHVNGSESSPIRRLSYSNADGDWNRKFTFEPEVVDRESPTCKNRKCSLFFFFFLLFGSTDADSACAGEGPRHDIVAVTLPYKTFFFSFFAAVSCF